MALPATPNGLGAIKQAAAANGLNWKPLAAIAYHESGLNPGSIGDNGTSFGLFQLHQGGALPRGTSPQQALNPQWNANFAARQIKSLGITGTPEQQIAAISRRFERPADPATEIARATAYYRANYAGLPQQAAAAPQSPTPTLGTQPQPTTAPAAPTVNLAAYQQTANLRQQANQRALDALGKISGVSRLAPQAPDLASLTQSTLATQQTQPIEATKPQAQHVTVPLKGVVPKGISPEGQKAVELAKHYIGTPYVFGGAKPGGFDCSGLLQYVWGKLGVKIPRVAADQFKAGHAVNPNDLRPGDALAFSENGTIGHIGMYIGGGQFIQAPHTGDHVKISPLAGHYQSILAGARRYA